MIYFQVGGRPLGGKVEPESQRGDERKLFVGMLRKNHIFKKVKFFNFKHSFLCAFRCSKN